MLQLQSQNLLVEETFLQASRPDYDPVTLDRIVTDFDFTTFHITTPASKDKILLSIKIKCWQDLVENNVISLLNEIYNCVTVLDSPEPGWDFSIYIDLKDLQSKPEEEREEIVSKLSLLKRNCFAAPFLAAFSRYDELSKQQPVDPNNIYGESNLPDEKVLTINYREEESIYIKPSNDRVTVIFSTFFHDETDAIFSKVFLQEFNDARKRSIQTAPQVINSYKEPPLEIRNLVSPFGGKEHNMTYVTFVLFPRHLSTEEIRWNTLTHIQMFRSYFHYHIKIVKCYLHQRMRYRVNGFMKVLNRARKDQDDEGKEKERKTASGRRFEAN